MKKVSFPFLLLLGFSVGWFILPVATNLFGAFTKFLVQYVCCEDTTKAAKVSLGASYFLVFVMCLLLSKLITKNHSTAFAFCIAVGVIASIFLSFYVHETPFALWLRSPFIEATITAICIPVVAAVPSRVWLTHHSSGTPSGAP
ncbi:MAG: hypothetical protein ABL903_20390 [Methylococcales bacterium]